MCVLAETPRGRDHGFIRGGNLYAPGGLALPGG